jgi:hypothetical protein
MPTLTAGGPVDLGDETHTLSTGLTGPDASGITITAAQLIQGVIYEEVDGYGETTARRKSPAVFAFRGARGGCGATR